MRTWTLAFAMLLALTWQAAAPAAESPAPPRPVPDYMRYAEDAKSARLEVAIRSFSLPSGQQVDLIGVVHIADDAYYQALNRRFTGYDSVLFELVGNPRLITQVAPEVLRARAAQEFSSGTSTFQQTVARYLNLTFQLGAIDYTGRNMVHADTSAAEFERMQQERGENMLTLLFRAMSAQMTSGPHNAALNELNLFALLRILMSPDAAAEFKKALARVFDQSEAMMEFMEAREGSAILSGRNEVALRKLQEVLANRSQRRIALFYGSGHMPGFEAALTGKLNARVTGEEWLPAWTMPR